MTDNNIKILIVDDFITLRMSLKSVLEKLGYQKWIKQKMARKQLINYKKRIMIL